MSGRWVSDVYKASDKLIIRIWKQLTGAFATSRGRAVRAMLHGRRESLSAQRMTLSGDGL